MSEEAQKKQRTVTESRLHFALPHAAGFRHWLESQGYTAGTINGLIRLLGHWTDWVHGAGFTLDTIHAGYDGSAKVFKGKLATEVWLRAGALFIQYLEERGAILLRPQAAKGRLAGSRAVSGLEARFVPATSARNRRCAHRLTGAAARGDAACVPSGLGASQAHAGRFSYKHRAPRDEARRGREPASGRPHPAPLCGDSNAPARRQPFRRQCSAASPIPEDDAALRQGGLQLAVGDCAALGREAAMLSDDAERYL